MARCYRCGCDGYSLCGKEQSVPSPEFESASMHSQTPEGREGKVVCGECADRKPRLPEGMTMDEIISQLESLKDNSKSFIGNSCIDDDEIWEKDIVALDFAIEVLRGMER